MLQPKLQLSLHMCTPHSALCLPAYVPQHCRPLLSSSPTAASRHRDRPQGDGLHVSSAAGPVPRLQLLSWYSSLNKQVGTLSARRGTQGC